MNHKSITMALKYAKLADNSGKDFYECLKFLITSTITLFMFENILIISIF